MLILLANQFALGALTIALIHWLRWRIELFFGRIKQQMRVRGILVTNPNGARVQIRTAICAYLLAAIAKRESALPGSLHHVRQVISIAASEKLPLSKLFANLDTTNNSIVLGNPWAFKGSGQTAVTKL